MPLFTDHVLCGTLDRFRLIEEHDALAIVTVEAFGVRFVHFGRQAVCHLIQLIERSVDDFVAHVEQAADLATRELLGDVERRGVLRRFEEDVEVAFFFVGPFGRRRTKQIRGRSIRKRASPCCPR